MDLLNIAIVLIGDLDMWLKISEAYPWILEEVHSFNWPEWKSVCLCVLIYFYPTKSIYVSRKSSISPWTMTKKLFYLYCSMPNHWVVENNFSPFCGWPGFSRCFLWGIPHVIEVRYLYPQLLSGYLARPNVWDNSVIWLAISADHRLEFKWSAYTLALCAAWVSHSMAAGLPGGHSKRWEAEDARPALSPLYSIGQSSYRAWPGFKRLQNRNHLLIGEMVKAHFRRACEMGDIVRGSLENTIHHNSFKEMSYHIL